MKKIRDEIKKVFEKGYLLNGIPLCRSIEEDSIYYNGS
jgi:hypothetical protein